MLPTNRSKTSPSFSNRDGAIISLIVVHATGGSFASGLAWLCNPESRVSAHFLIAKNGSIYQLVTEWHAAWHAGKSAWRGLDSAAIQVQSIGIELANANDGRDPYPAAQIDACRLLCDDLISRYSIPQTMLVRHLDIAIPPGRKTDPAGFPWDTFVASLYPRAYRVAGLPVYQRSTRTGPLWGVLRTGEPVTIDDPTNGHDSLGRGFMDIHGLEPPA